MKYKYLTKEVLIFDRYSYDYLILLKNSDVFFNKILYYLFYYFPEPDNVLFLKIKPEIAFKRKKEFDVQYLKERQIKLSNAINCKKKNSLLVFDSSVNIEKAYEFFK